MQINSIHLRRLSSYGISRDALMHPCISVYGSVAVARDDQQIRKYLGCSRGLPFRNAGERDKYAHAIHSILLRRGVIAE